MLKPLLSGIKKPRYQWQRGIVIYGVHLLIVALAPYLGNVLA